MSNKLFSLFNTSGVSGNPSVVNNTVSPTLSVAAVMQPNETYAAFGHRICLVTNGNVLTLRTILQRIYSQEKANQIKDEKLQQQQKIQISKEINENELEIENQHAHKRSLELEINNTQTSISELKQKLSEAKNKIGQENKMARLKLTLGCIIIAILTVYLFVFYGSTFYSAFFKNFGSAEISIGSAMFDANAFVNALNAGFGELIFILSAPIIFMGLGFALHFFSIQKGSSKYLKIASVVIVTFVFDCILAYSIAKKIYEINAISMWGDVEPFGLNIAIKDIDFWAVIFCGFVVYIIWGIVFDMTMTAYEDLKMNKTEIEQIELKLDNQKQNLSTSLEKYNIADSIIKKLQIKKSDLNNQLNSKLLYNPNLIRNAFTQFFQGWTTVLGALLMPVKDSEDVYNEEVKNLLS